MPILGIIASSFRSAGGGPQGAYDSLATITVPSGGLASVTFAGIPSTYKHLQIRALVKDNRSGSTSDNNYLRFNNDGAANYSAHQLLGTGSSVVSAALTSDNEMLYATVPGASIGSSIFNATVVDILDYANTNKYKVIRSLSGYDSNGDGTIRLISGLWQSTSAIDRIDIYTNDGVPSTIQQYSSFALYGIK